MKIMVSESSATTGGQELAVLLHAEGLRKRGHDIRLVLEPGSPIYEMATRKGLPVKAISMGRHRYPLAIWALRRLMTAQKPDIVHVNSSRDSWIAALAARLVPSRPKLVRTRHISTPLNRNVMTRFLYRRLLDMVIVTGGELTRRALIERDGLEPERVTAFPIGIDLEYFRPGPPERDLRLELGLGPDHRLVGLISYLRAYKGHEYFIEAASHVLTREKDVTFLIVGEGPEEQRIRACIARLGLAKQVRLLGYRADLLDVFRSLDLFVIPTVEADTIPQVLMQALALALPVVSTTVGSIPDVIRDRQTGFLVPPRHAEALAERIMNLLADPRLREELGGRGRALVEREYSLESMLDRLEAVYRRLAAA
ncbi:MAG: glycosyltransferase family 4 protein [Nitrospirae bacterium]|nr:glycosyltransferase family 4 protein [Nitrospirota bacterium]MCZ6780706.1 glycosyltransferase family 4 protein [Nitrospirota bacterium]